MGALNSKNKGTINKVGDKAEEAEKKKKLVWIDCQTFADLDEEGQQEFLRFAQRRKYTIHARRIEFYFLLPELGLEKTLSKVVGNEDDDPLPELAENTKKVLKNAKEIDAVCLGAKDKMKEKLKPVFKEFQEFLGKDL